MIQALAALKQIEEAISITSFIDHAFEMIEDSEEDEFLLVAQVYSQDTTLANPEEEEQTTVPIKALADLATLRLYEEQQEDGSHEVVKTSTDLTERSESVRLFIASK
jgi:hypothetical protein